MNEVIQNFIVVDDDPINNILCTRIIKKVFPAAQVFTFTDVGSAIFYIVSTYEDAAAPDAMLFLDINMPLVNGWDFLNAFEQFDINIKLHFSIYMLTSSFDLRDKKRAAENINVLDYLEKPLNIDKLKNITCIVHE